MRVKATRATWVLFLIAGAVALILTLVSAATREERRAPAAPAAPADAGYVVEVELAP